MAEERYGTVWSGSTQWSVAEPGAGCFTQNASKTLGCRRRGLPTASAVIQRFEQSVYLAARRGAPLPLPGAVVFRVAASG